MSLDTMNEIQNAEYSIPMTSTRLELSQLINTLLGREQPLAFDFLVENTFLHTTLGDHMSTNELSGEHVLVIEYLLAQIPPSGKYTFKVSDWVSTIIPSLNEHFPLPDSIVDAALASLYDGSLVLFNFQHKDDTNEGEEVIVGARHQVCKLFSTPIKATCLVDLEGQIHIAAGGYEGRIICSTISGPSVQFVHEVEYTGLNSPILSMANTRKFTHMAAGTVDGFVYLYDTTRERLGKHLSSVKAEPKRKRVHGKIIIKEPTQKISFSFQSTQTAESRRHNPFTTATDINDITFNNSQNTLYIAAGCADNCIRFYNLIKNMPAGLLSANSSCQVLKYTEESNDLLLCGFNDKSLKLYDTRKEKPLAATFLGHKSSITCLDVRGNMIISGSIGGDLCVWDPRSSVPLWTADCFYRELDHKKDQSRLLACAFGLNSESPVFYHGGSDRRITMRKIVEQLRTSE